MEDKLEAEDKTKVETALTKLKELNEKYQVETMSDEQVEELKAAKEELTQAFYAISEKMYANQAPQGAPDMGGEQTSNANDAVIDADFKEE